MQREKGEVEFVPFGAADKIKLSVGIVQNMVAVRTRSGQVPTERDALKFIALCRSQRLNPFAGDAYLIGYDSREGATFSLITSHSAFLKRAESHPEFDGIVSGIIVTGNEEGSFEDVVGDFFDPDRQQLVGGWATVYFKSRKYPMKKRVALRTFNKGFGQWNVDPAGMISKVAEVHALRDSFPSLLGGLYAEGEASVIAMDDRAAAPKSTGIVLDTEPIKPQEPAPAAPATAPTQPQTLEHPRRRRSVQPATPAPAAPVPVPAPTQQTENSPQDDGDLGPAEPTQPQQEQPAPAPAAPAQPAPRTHGGESTPQELMEAFVSVTGATFDQFRDAAESIGCGHSVDGCGSYADMKKDACEFLLTSKRKSLLAMIRTIREQGQGGAA